MAKMIEMVATETCYLNDRIYRAGDKFLMPEGTKSRAFHPVGEAPPPKAPSVDRMIEQAEAKKKAEAEAKGK